jgi:hypothetical protein
MPPPTLGKSYCPVENVCKMLRSPMNLGEFLTRWSALLALSLYVVGLALRASANGTRPKLAWARRAWTAGCLIFLFHVACAFQFAYDWSHTVAYAATARRTAEVVGLEWGGGLYANYAFTLLWVADTCWWWRGLGRYEARPRAVDWVVQGFLGFMAFNATVVFGTGTVRWLGLAACLFLAFGLGIRKKLLS